MKQTHNINDPIVRIILSAYRRGKAILAEREQQQKKSLSEKQDQEQVKDLKSNKGGDPIGGISSHP
jgi:hypothetical protein